MDVWAKQALLYIGFGLLATIGSIVKKWWTSPDDVNLPSYFGKDHGKYTIASVGSFLASAVFAIGPGALDGMNFYQVAVAGMLAAAAIDGQIGKSAKKFTDEAIAKTLVSVGVEPAESTVKAVADAPPLPKP